MIKARPSILRVLGWRLGLVSAIFVILVVMLLQSKLQRAADSLFHQTLEDEARSIAARLTPAGNGEIGFLGHGALDEQPSIFRYRVLDEQGGVLFASSGLPRDLTEGPGLAAASPRALEALGDRSPGGVSFVDLRPPVSRNHVMGAMLTTEIGARRVFVQVFEDLDERGVLLDDLVRDFFVEAGWLLVPFVALLLLVNLVSIWAELRPLTRISGMAAEIGPETTGRRLPEEGQPREVLLFVRSVNRALERLDQGFQMQRQFTADAAHELRTPLAVLSAHLDSLGDGKALAALRQEVSGMSRLVSQLLRIAQLDSLTLTPSDRVDLHAIAVDAASALAPLALKQGKSIAVSGTEAPIWALGDIEALTQAIRNLIENALAHTPKGTTVEIELGPKRSVRIMDSGPGVPLESREHIFRRFWRADRRTGGAGLGLAIVAKVAQTHGGRVYVEAAPTGGAAFVLELPALGATSAAAEAPRAARDKAEDKEKALS